MRSTKERCDWRMITNTWRALMAISHAPPEPGRRVVGRVVVADDGSVDVAEAVDLGRAQEAHVDQPALKVEAEELEHPGHGGGPGDDGGVADGQRQAGRPGSEDARFVDQLEVGGHGQRRARLTAMLGRPTPTKHTRCPASSRAAATIIISLRVKGCASGAHGRPPPAVRPPRNGDISIAVNTARPQGRARTFRQLHDARLLAVFGLLPASR